LSDESLFFFIYDIHFVATSAAPWTVSPKAAAQLPTATKQHPCLYGLNSSTFEFGSDSGCYEILPQVLL
jgi:hypothetical protein